MVVAAGADLADCLLDRHPTFQRAQAALLRALARFGGASLDDAARLASLPNRTLLLIVAHLVDKGTLTTSEGRIQKVGDGSISGGPGIPSSDVIGGRRVTEDAFRLYSESVRRLRPEPALLWTQRWLTAPSARWRAEFIANYPTVDAGPILFLGEDDAVSPLLASLEPDREIIVVDVDAAVLEMLAQIADEMSVAISFVHHDLSVGPPKVSQTPAAVVCDPFPTKDGSFEYAFWTQAAGTLEAGGLLFTTSHPSHKPSAFAALALRALDDAGFVLLDATRSAGQYALFDFELTGYERQVLEELALTMETSHTKSFLCAERTDRPLSMRESGLSESPKDLASHYLTQQYGVQDQVQITVTRGASPVAIDLADADGFSPLDVTSILKGLDLDEVDGLRLSSFLAEGDIESTRRYLGDVASLSASEGDVRSLIALRSDVAPETPATERLALIVRALESWNR